MTISDRIAELVTLELSRHRSEINADVDLRAVKILVRVDREKGTALVSISRESERVY